jgi:hypothetical protein
MLVYVDSELKELDALADSAKAAHEQKIPFRPDRTCWTNIQLFAIDIGIREPSTSE